LRYALRIPVFIGGMQRSKSVKHKAVIFDLWGTLVPGMPRQEYQLVLERMAASLSVPLDDFNRIWFETARERNLGTIKSIEDNIRYICEHLRVRVGDAEFRRAVQIRLEFTTRTMRPRPDAIEVLSHLKSRGFKLGLISNCSCDNPVVWKDTPFVPLFDVIVFSSSVGMVKPDPRIYLLAAEQLAVKPEDCLYVGDGASQELPGAAGVGMTPVLIRVSGDGDEDNPYRIKSDEWGGLRVSSLSEVLKLLECYPFISVISTNRRRTKGDTPLESPAKRGYTPLDTPKR
jgi:putative hydrolase of the HAD superfamily